MHAARTRHVLTALIGLLAVLVAGFVLAAPANAADTDIKINEVSSNPADFVELINTGVMPLGSMCLNRIDHSGNPAALAACTKSWLRSLKNSARMNRADRPWG